MARAFWKGAISFGLVVIPVKMYVATESKSLGLHLLHRKCLTRPKQVLYCGVDNEYFDSKQTVKAYEYTKGQYVVLDESDFKKVPVKTTHTIDILGFVNSQEIDPIYYYGSHYLEPEELAVKPYALLREAMRKMGWVGIAKVSFQRRENLCCLRPMDGILALHAMHYKDEIFPRSELAPPEQKLSPEEVEMAVSLVKTMAKVFQPEEYKDEYRQALKTIIEAKIKGEEIKVPKAPKIEIPDLMSALRASIEAARKRTEEEKATVTTK